jgi:cytoskeletal protein CcmA (bactofilin family)
MANRDSVGNEAETIIAASVKVEGDFVSQGNVLIEGTVEGSLRTERNLRVGERASISADVEAASATVAGEVHGNLAVSERLELEPTARIHGDIQTGTLIVANGAQINGRLTMGEAIEATAGKKGRGAKAKAEAEVEPEVAEELVAEEATEEQEEPVNAFFGR